MSMAIGAGNPGWNRYGLKSGVGTSGTQISFSRSAYQVRSDSQARAAQRMKEQMQKANEARKKQQQKKKKVNYNFKQISRRIIQAKTSSNARRVLQSAKQKVVELRRKVKTSLLDNQELLNAIQHAEAMARVAKKKLKHLEEEENVKLRGGPCEADAAEKTEEAAEADQYAEMAESEEADAQAFDMEDLQELMELYQELMEEALQDMERMSDLEDLMLETPGVEMDPEDLEQMKKKHRSKELREIMEADMKYLKAMFDKLAKDQQSGAVGIGSGGGDGGRGFAVCDTGGVALELGGVDIPIEAGMVSAVELVEGGMVDASA